MIAVLNLISGLAVTLLTAINLPNGFEQIPWGTSAQVLQQIVPVHKAQQGSEYSYAEHMEIDPDVYVRKAADNQRLEYYLFNNQVYKIFIVYDRSDDDNLQYNQLVDKFIGDFGKPHSTYDETVFGIAVTHTIWEDEHSTLDVRHGAGYVYQVRVNKKLIKEKSLLQQQRNSI